MPKTTVRENETLDDALRRFKRQVNKAGIISEVKKHDFYFAIIMYIQLLLLYSTTLFPSSST